LLDAKGFALFRGRTLIFFGAGSLHYNPRSLHFDPRSRYFMPRVADLSIGKIRHSQREKREKAWAEVKKLPFYRRFTDSGILKEQADIYHCTLAEIVSVISGYGDGKGLDILVSERKITRQELGDVSPPDFIIGETPQFAKQVSHLDGNALRGLGVAAGKAAGTARLIFHPNEAEKLQPYFWPMEPLWLVCFSN